MMSYFIFSDYFVKKIATCVLEQVEDEFKAFDSFIIRVGYIIVVGAQFHDVIAHHHDFSFLLRRGSEVSEVAAIAFVHGNYDVEEVEIIARNGSCAMV